MQTQFMAAINQLASEKNLPKEKVMEIVCHALRAAYRKDYGNRDQNIEVELDEKTGNAHVLKIMDVVDSAKAVEIPDIQMPLAEARKYKKDVEVGGQIKIDVTPHDYGRIAAQSAKQVIIQRIQEAEKDIITDMYKDREHEILNGYVNRVEGPTVYVDLERTQSFLRPQDQIPRESYHNGQRIKVYLDKVVSSAKGPRLLISRSHPRLVNCLLEMEIPEVREGVVEIKAIAREAGVRTKVAVSSNDPNVDPIGACVGQKGARIQNIMEEFNGERIDIILFREEPREMLRAALAPAQIAYIEMNDTQRRAAVFVPVEERALAIGKQGQNVRLASMLTGWEIDIIDLEKLDPEKRAKLQAMPMAPMADNRKKKEKKPAAPVMPVAAEDIANLPGLSKEVTAKLNTAGFMKSIQLMGLNAEALMGIEGITEDEAKVIEAALTGKAPEVNKVKESKEVNEVKESNKVKEVKEVNKSSEVKESKEVKNADDEKAKPKKREKKVPPVVEEQKSSETDSKEPTGTSVSEV